MYFFSTPFNIDKIRLVSCQYLYILDKDFIGLINVIKLVQAVNEYRMSTQRES